MKTIYIVTRGTKTYFASPWAYSCFKVKSYLTARGMSNISITKYVGKQFDKMFKWKKGDTR